jgi:hypothetical protein
VDKRWLALNIVLAAVKPSIGNVIVAKRKMKNQFISMKYEKRTKKHPQQRKLQ